MNTQRQTGSGMISAHSVRDRPGCAEKRFLINETIPTGGVQAIWLGQAGFIFRTARGRSIVLDPHLSDACERLFGFRRLSLPALKSEEVVADWVILTHEHADHLDPDSLPVIARNNPACRFAAPLGCTTGLNEAGIAPARRVVLEPNRRHDLGDLIVHAVPADHGELSPTALSLVLDFGALRVAVSGDTGWNDSLVAELTALRPDLLLTVINGGFGNLDHEQAARLAAALQPRWVIPCHFWTLSEQGAGDPQGFIKACRERCPAVHPLLLTPGRGMIFPQ